MESDHARVRLAETRAFGQGACSATDLLLGLGASQRLVGDGEAGPGHQDVRGCG